MCVCGCAHLYVCIYMGNICPYMCLWRSEVDFKMFSSVTFHFCFGDRVFSLNTSFCWPNWPARSVDPLVSACVPFLILELQVETPTLDFLLNVEDSNSGPHTFVVSPLPTDPHSPPSFGGLKRNGPPSSEI